MPTEKWKFPYSLFSPITHIIIWAHFGLRIGCKKAGAYVIKTDWKKMALTYLPITQVLLYVQCTTIPISKI